MSRERTIVIRALPQIVSPREVRLALGVSESTLYRMRRERLIPEPVKLSKARIGWPRDVIELWIEGRATKSEGGERQ
jgi:predicted DNA-binding transcriptional regulator AlpA